MPIETTNLEPLDDSSELETRDMLLNIGPAHPAMHGIIRIVTKLDGERIHHADVEIEAVFLAHGPDDMRVKVGT